ncbi:helix-turn-helix transcriptional regulator [Longispora sp. K20-0274]|uniref:helix-turn-helix domain-containing protein n=1 Tax=Longispora sp. K20-0274 TaxID=3088255 RepID=UPI00399BD7B7
MVSDGRSTPYPLRSRLARHLRLLRDESGLTIGAVGRRLGCSGSKVSRIETGQCGITVEDAERLLDIYKVTGPRRDWMLTLAMVGEQRAVWGAYRHFEAAAKTVLNYEPIVVPGILQHPEYALALMRAEMPDSSPAHTTELMTSRMSRQVLLTKDGGPDFHLLLDETVLHRPVGDERVMRAQLRRLLELAELPSVTLRVIPFDAVGHPARQGSFAVMRFPDDLDPGIVALEHRLTTLYLDEPADVEAYREVFRRLNQIALDPDATAKLVARLATGR